MTNKCSLRYLTSIGSNNADVAKLFNSGRNIVGFRVKYHMLIDILRDPEDDNAMLQVLREVHQFKKMTGYYHATVYLREKA